MASSNRDKQGFRTPSGKRRERCRQVCTARATDDRLVAIKSAQVIAIVSELVDSLKLSSDIATTKQVHRRSAAPAMGPIGQTRMPTSERRVTGQDLPVRGSAQTTR
jgi:hypothetical protein